MTHIEDQILFPDQHVRAFAAGLKLEDVLTEARRLLTAVIERSDRGGDVGNALGGNLAAATGELDYLLEPGDQRNTSHELARLAWSMRHARALLATPDPLDVVESTSQPAPLILQVRIDGDNRPYQSVIGMIYASSDLADATTANEIDAIGLDYTTERVAFERDARTALVLKGYKTVGAWRWYDDGQAAWVQVTRG